jgi:branched-chain amino acid aminotransferase
VITPPVTASILESITRATVMTLLREEIVSPATEAPIDRTELYLADEIFLAGTAAEIVPIVSVDGLQIGTGEPGAITRRVQKAYDDAVRGRLPRYERWLTPVYGASVKAKERA